MSCNISCKNFKEGKFLSYKGADWRGLIREKVDIVSVVSKSLNLKKKGKTWWACCPFHYEKTPSFAVNENEQYYHCFGCGASGDLISFVQKYENMDFVTACRTLAQEYGIELPEYTQDKSIELKRKKADRLRALLKDAAKYYYTVLRSEKGTPAVEYLKRRKLDDETITAFGLGYSPGWRDIIFHLKDKGYTYEEMYEAGVAGKKDSSYYDFYNRRLIFPLINVFGDVVGFSARILEDKNFAKYVNTPQTLLFDKSRCVYGINLVKKYKQQNPLNEIIIVEGQVDVISLYKNGVKNAVACLGTALTASHAKELKKLTDKIVVCFDGDGAGMKATLRSIETLVANDLNVYVATIPNKQDPDEFINQHGKDKFIELVEGAKYWVEFLILKYSKDYDTSKLEEKNKFILEALNIIKNLATDSEKDIYLNLVHRLTGVSVTVLKGDMLRGSVSAQPKETETKELTTNKGNAYVKAVNFVLRALLDKKQYAFLADDIKENILNNDYKKVYEYVEESKNSGSDYGVGALFEMFDVENNPDINSIIGFEISQQEDNENIYSDCVKTLIKSGLSMRQQILTDKLSQTTNEEEKREIKMQMLSIINQLNKLKNR